MRHVWSVLCTKSTIDRETNNISLFEVVERIEIHAPRGISRPFGFPFHGDLVTLWAREDQLQPERGQMRASLMSPAGDTLADFNAEVDLESGNRSRNIAHLEGLKVAGSGWHELVIRHRRSSGDAWHEVARIPLEVEVVEAADSVPLSAAS